MLTDVFVHTKERRRESAPDYVEALREMARTGARKKARSRSYADGFTTVVSRRTTAVLGAVSFAGSRLFCPFILDHKTRPYTRGTQPNPAPCTRYRGSPTEQGRRKIKTSKSKRARLFVVSIRTGYDDLGVLSPVKTWKTSTTTGGFDRRRPKPTDNSITYVTRKRFRTARRSVDEWPWSVRRRPWQ